MAADNDVAGDRAAIEEIERAVEANAVLQTAPLVLLEVKGGCVTEHVQGDVEFEYFDHDNVRTYGEPPVMDPDFRDLVTKAFGDVNVRPRHRRGVHGLGKRRGLRREHHGRRP